MTKLVGIVNITPDSFSDGGRYVDVKAAIAHMEKLWDEGADVLDIGAESTRPGAIPMSAEEEWQRLLPLFQSLKQTEKLSLDTRHPANARRALDIGFGYINDVSGFTSDKMIYTVRGYDAKLVVMHSLSVPADRNITLPAEGDVVKTLIEFADERRKALVHSGIAEGRIIFDPGIGFGKTSAQSHEILTRIDELKTLEMPLYIGHSRKSFLLSSPSSHAGEGGVGGKHPLDIPTLIWSEKLMQAGVDYLRVHDVRAHDALRQKVKYGSD